jgi:hypothetical protein
MGPVTAVTPAVRIADPQSTLTRRKTGRQSERRSFAESFNERKRIIQTFAK